MIEGSVDRVPVVRTKDRLLVSIRGALDDGTIRRLRDDVSTKINAGDARALVIDVSGMDVLDSFIARSLRDLALLARLMGVDTVVCGLDPSVALTLVEMGLDLHGVTTALDLDAALSILDAHAQPRRPSRPGERGLR